MKVLGIETSCDETGIAIYDGNSNQIISEKLFSQAAKHSDYGGVVPELASRDHVKKLIPLLSETIKESGINADALDGIAYTAGPGLRGPLLTGAALAQALGLGWGIPCIGVHHMEAHLLINLLEDPAPSFPFLTLLISGGHCLIIRADDFSEYKVLGQSRDDAVGEAFDKVAKLLDLGYPGGPKIEELATRGDPNAFNFPRPMTKESHLDFSFSGLKTAVLYAFRSEKDPSDTFKSDLAASFQEAVADTLFLKSQLAIAQNGLEQLVIGGGVASNKYIRKKLIEGLKGNKIFFPPINRCTDNGAMVAVTGHYRLSKKNISSDIVIRPKWNLSEL
ncbi:tRNA (adenosine(37)-N6)-threonylcarbamoyltransferase complex transferase subunit TsaD [Gammaproteobacteria bacterium]|jgi:N6-L-threonylcarbamoyladenine synthase|nr:tRNA (adenosine(37)-N6)-threonylcarbamoyltransferase complex transferase subunit TsaD [Gammaproteobacteria bacterium]